MKTRRVRFFTLTEVMAAMALLMLVASGIYGSLILGEFMVTEARFRSEAQALATDEAWMLFHNPYDNVRIYPLVADFTDTSAMRILTKTGTAVSAISFQTNIPTNAFGIEMDVADVPGYENSVLARTGVLKRMVVTETDHVVITTQVSWNRRAGVRAATSFSSETKTLWRYDNDR